MKYKIVVGNKNYSSWSMRPWLVLDHFAFDYDEEVVPLDEPDTRARLLALSPSGKVPVLLEGAFAVWDSLAIIEYLAEMRPDAGIWPAPAGERARARSLAAEMHAGFAGLRAACPMNLRKVVRFRHRGGPQVDREVDRFEGLVRDCLMRSGSAIGFLFLEDEAPQQRRCVPLRL